MKRLLVLSAALVAASSLVFADSLADIAKRERERREKNAEAGVKPVKTFTQDNVRKGAADTATADEGKDKDGAVDSALDPEKSTSDGASAASGDEQSWRNRARPLRERVESARAQLAATPKYLAKTTSNKIDGGRQNATTPDTPNPAYAAAEQRLQAAEAAMSALEEEARRARVLPGWLR
jgi:hypothetical protein